jgi:hypothetical protein
VDEFFCLLLSVGEFVCLFKDHAHVRVTLTLSLFDQSKNHLPPDLAADEKPYILTITHNTYWAARFYDYW